MSKETILFEDLKIGEQFTRPQFPNFVYEKTKDLGGGQPTAKMTQIPEDREDHKIGDSCYFVPYTQVVKYENA